jgi:hypothetical protein
MRRPEVVIRRANTVEPFEQIYLFACWTLKLDADSIPPV